jgi:spore coat polysaccharide biosynthesis predicted glycosyltransferase SpsG/CMP-N-acetylneuraminic acid synthetase
MEPLPTEPTQAAKLGVRDSVGMSILIVIPARGSPRGIPRKNLRSLGGRPLLSYPIQTALASQHRPLVLVSSEDEGILCIAGKLKAETYRRDLALSLDRVNLDSVVIEAYRNIAERTGAHFDLVVTMLPTSPLLKPTTLDRALDHMLAHPEVDTLISVRKTPYFMWRKIGGSFQPAYEKRVSRQELAPSFRETGAFLIARAKNLESGQRIKGLLQVFELEDGEEIDIDSQEDWSTCEYFLNRRKLVFVVCGSRELGLGHVYRSLVIANELPLYEICFMVVPGHDLAAEKIREHGYHVDSLEAGDFAQQVLALRPNMVVNDILDTHEDYIRKLKSGGVKVINFEDLGPGSREADVVVNAVYPDGGGEKPSNVYSGYKYFCTRDEFLFSDPKVIDRDVRNVLLTFGGADENNITLKVLRAIAPYCCSRGIEITIVVGPGNNHFESLLDFPDVVIVRNTNNISDYMLAADLIFTSAGRTTYEIACLGVPTIVLAQNPRELTHLFAHPDNGFVNLGLGVEVADESILQTFVNLAQSYEDRRRSQECMLAKDVRSSKRNVIDLIKRTMGDHR